MCSESGPDAERRRRREADLCAAAALRPARASRPAFTVEIFYLSASEVVLVPPGNDDKRIDEYREAIDGIERGDFRTTTEPGAVQAVQPTSSVVANRGASVFFSLGSLSLIEGHGGPH